MSNSKYKISDIAKDFKCPVEEITSHLNAFGTEVKTPTQAMTDSELSFVFDRMTMQHQTKDMETALHREIKAVAKPAQKPLQPKVAPQTTGQARPAQPSGQARPQATGQARPPQAGQNRPQQARPPQQFAAGQQRQQEPRRQQTQTQKFVNAQTAVRPQQTKPGMAAPSQHPAQRKPQMQRLELTPNQNEAKTSIQSGETSDAIPAKKITVVDTRGSSVDLSRYDDRVDSLVSAKADKMSQSQNKQKIVKKADARKPFGQKKRYEEQEKLKRLELQKIAARKVQLKVLIPEEIIISELASRMKRTAADVIKNLMKLGVMAAINQTIDYETASLVAMEMGMKVEKEVFVTIEERLFDITEDKSEDLHDRSPVVVVMGHVDHGKTSLLDTIRNKNVATGEAGGITQHIGAYRTQVNGHPITFLDTPGHAAFTSMRARGAQVTDVAILVVAADDGVMPQTIEAINHAKAANTPIIVAVNKMDKPAANPDRILQQLTEYGVVTEAWGGETIVCKISAKMNEGIDHLLEMVLLVAEMADLKANPNRSAKGTVIEAKLDKGRGPVATVLVQNGTLRIGDVIIAGTSVGRVRAMNDEGGQKMEEAGPSVPVEIIGLAEVPNAGDVFYAVEDERMARTLVDQRKEQEKQDKNNAVSKVTLDNLFDHIQDGTVKNLNIIVKADVHGSAEALRASLEKISCEEVRVKVIHSAVGAVTESDVMLASASGAIIVGFNVRPEKAAAESADMQAVDIRLYRIIYDCIEEMEQAMKGLLTPVYKEVILGHAEIRQVFKVTGVGTVAGSYVTDGKIVRNSKVRLVRDGIVAFEGELDSLKRFKDDAKEVATGYECGIGLEKYNDIKEGDIIEAFTMEEIKR